MVLLFLQKYLIFWILIPLIRYHLILNTFSQKRPPYLVMTQLLFKIQQMHWPPAILEEKPSFKQTIRNPVKILANDAFHIYTVLILTQLQSSKLQLVFSVSSFSSCFFICPFISCDLLVVLFSTYFLGFHNHILL